MNLFLVRQNVPTAALSSPNLYAIDLLDSHGLLLQQQLQGVTHAESGGGGGDVGKPALIAGAGQVKVHPGNLFVHEAV